MKEIHPFLGSIQTDRKRPGSLGGQGRDSFNPTFHRCSFRLRSSGSCLCHFGNAKTSLALTKVSNIYGEMQHE